MRTGFLPLLMAALLTTSACVNASQEKPKEPMKQEDVLNYWFSDQMTPKEWFSGGEKIDKEIRERFAGYVQAATRGHLDDWRKTPRGRLALIILLDQFTRNIHRDKPDAFAQDWLARSIVLEGLVHREDLALTPIERAFFYMPLQHAEDAQFQELSVELFSELVEDADPQERPSVASFLEHAKQHQKVIADFGRFPTRNGTLQRPNSTKEADYLSKREGAAA